jgi:hypothetical protein
LARFQLPPRWQRHISGSKGKQAGEKGATTTKHDRTSANSVETIVIVIAYLLVEMAAGKHKTKEQNLRRYQEVGEACRTNTSSARVDAKWRITRWYF